jgi:hypothetical protein
MDRLVAMAEAAERAIVPAYDRHLKFIFVICRMTLRSGFTRFRPRSAPDAGVLKAGALRRSMSHLHPRLPSREKVPFSGQLVINRLECSPRRRLPIARRKQSLLDS